MEPNTTPEAGSIVTRRRVLAGTGASVAGGAGLLTLGSDPAEAQVTMGELAVTGDEASVDNPPSRIDVSVSGEYAIDSSTVPEKVETILQVHVDGMADDLAMQTDFDTQANTYSITADIFSNHKDISQGYFTPDAEGGEKSTEILVRVVCRAVVDGWVEAEAFVEDTAIITIGLNGMEVAVGGTGSTDIVV
jgi:hypothetical protein